MQLVKWLHDLFKRPQPILDSQLYVWFDDRHHHYRKTLVIIDPSLPTSTVRFTYSVKDKSYTLAIPTTVYEVFNERHEGAGIALLVKVITYWYDPAINTNSDKDTTIDVDFSKRNPNFTDLLNYEDGSDMANVVLELNSLTLDHGHFKKSY